MCFLDEFKAQNQNLVFTNSIYRRRHGNKYAPSDQISGLDLIPMLSFCELRSRDHHNTTFTLIFYKNQQNLRTKAFIFAIRTKIRTKKGLIFR